jgi:hypothetical protein
VCHDRFLFTDVARCPVRDVHYRPGSRVKKCFVMIIAFRHPPVHRCILRESALFLAEGAFTDRRKEEHKEVFMKGLVIVLLVVAVAAGVMTPGSVVAEPESSVNLGLGGVIQTMPHCKAYVYFVEYEHMLSPTVALLGRGSEVRYRFDNNEYLEQGRPKGIDVGARYYPAGGMKGFYISGTVGYWMADWTFTHNKDRADQFQGRGDNDSIRANLDIGGRFPIGSSSVSIMPSFNIGRFFPSSSCEYTAPSTLVGTACSQKSEVQNYMFLAVTMGMGF